MDARQVCFACFSPRVFLFLFRCAEESHSAGEAYVQFKTQEDSAAAKQRHQQPLGVQQQPIEVRLLHFWN